MSSYRAITDDVAISTSLNQLSHFGERLYWRLLARTDTWGRLPGELVKIRDLCIPRLAVSDSDLTDALEELVRAGRIALYCTSGTWACQLLDFDRHQPIARLKRSPSRWPAPPQTDTQTDTGHAEAAENPWKNGDQQRQKTETVRERSSGSPTAVVQYVELPDSELESNGESPLDKRLWFHHFDLVELARSLRGGDERTPYAIASVLSKPTPMPEAALASAIEQLERRRQKQPRLNSEVRYLVGTLATMRSEGQYA